MHVTVKYVLSDDDGDIETFDSKSELIECLCDMEDDVRSEIEEQESDLLELRDKLDELEDVRHEVENGIM